MNGTKSNTTKCNNIWKTKKPRKAHADDIFGGKQQKQNFRERKKRRGRLVFDLNLINCSTLLGRQRASFHFCFGPRLGPHYQPCHDPFRDFRRLRNLIRLRNKTGRRKTDSGSAEIVRTENGTVSSLRFSSQEKDFLDSFQSLDTQG